MSSIICVHFGCKSSGPIGESRNLVNFKGNLYASRALSGRYQCHLVIQVNVYPAWVIQRRDMTDEHTGHKADLS